jgi:hypothetical protein
LLNDKDLKTRQEADIRTCPHCQAVIKMQEWKKAAVQNFCMKCMQPTCEHAACQDCVPFVQKIERYVEAQLRRVRLLRG